MPKPTVHTGAKRKMPEDFALHEKKGYAELRRMYKTSNETIERWRHELQLSRLKEYHGRTITR